MELNTYLDFAENDYIFLIEVAKEGHVANAMGSIAANICEKYLKHIIEEEYIPFDELSSARKLTILKTHSLKKLMGFLEESMEVPIEENVRNALNSVDGYYFSTRYPGDESISLSSDDIDRAVQSVEVCRDFALKHINKSLSKEEAASEDQSKEEVPEETPKENPKSPPTSNSKRR